MNYLIGVGDGLISQYLPDRQELFINRSVVTIEDNNYLFCDYIGGKDISSDYDVDQYLDSLKPELIDVFVDNVSNSLPDFDDSDNSYTVYENTEVTVTGTISSPDQSIRVPFERVDTGRTQLMVATILNGKFTLNLNFKTGGKWVVNNVLINSEFDKPIFNIEEYTFYVV